MSVRIAVYAHATVISKRMASCGRHTGGKGGGADTRMKLATVETIVCGCGVVRETREDGGGDVDLRGKRAWRDVKRKRKRNGAARLRGWRVRDER
jgi:hypothetical protein